MKLFSRRPPVRRPAHARAGSGVHSKGIKGFVQKWRRLPLWKKIFVIAWPTALILVFTAIVTTLMFAGALGSKEALMSRNRTGVTMTDRDGKVFYQFANARSDAYVPLSAIAPIAQKALISSEDKNFYNEPGFSVTGILSAFYQNIISSGQGGGGSTITQQLVKNALLSQDRNVLRKYQELVLSLEVERRYSKDEILEMYMNSAYFGEGAFGIQDAAQAYFGKDAKDLDAAQASMLIGVLPAPSAYSPISGDINKAKIRQDYVLGRMQEDGVLTAEQADGAKNQQLAYKEARADDTPQAPHFALMVRDWLEQKYGEQQVAHSGFTVKTTLKLDYQAKAEEAVKKQVNNLRFNKVTNGSTVIMDPRSGEVLALVGSADWNNEQFGKLNMATAARQPGSSFKPIVYSTGIEDRDMTGATIFSDTPQTFGTYQPKNYDLGYRGDVTLRRALANSLNIPAVEAMNKIGVQTVMNRAKDLGITTLTRPASEYGLPLALGAGQVKLTEMTSAYATLANQGNHPDTQLVMSIQDKNKKEIYKEKPTSKRVFSEGTAFIMSSILSDNAARAEEFGSSLTVSNSRPVAVKTGTTDDYRDAWTMGYTPSLAIGVWIGNNDNSPMGAVAGSSGAAPIWRSLMQQILTGAAVEKFNQPSTVVSHAVCRNNGALATAPGNNTYTEYFLSSTLPTATCNEPPKQQTQQNTNNNSNSNNEEEQKDTTAPAAPTGLTATPMSATRVDLKWTASTDDTGVTGYRIYRNGRQVATANGTTYSDAGLTPLTTYIYTVVAVDAADNVSQQSASANATTLPGTGGTTTPTP